MGRASVKEDKSIYQKTRESLGLTRDAASELIGFMSADRIEKIENSKVNIQPDDILALSECYKEPSLCNHFCANECPIGQVYIPEVKIKNLSQIAIETLNALNKIDKEKNRLLEIVEDGEITPDEYEDFVNIKDTLDKISLSVETLQLWINKTVAEGRIDKSIFEK